MNASCSDLRTNIAISKLILDFTSWRNIDKITLLEFGDSGGCSTDVLLKKQLFQELSSRSIDISFNTKSALSQLTYINHFTVIIRVYPTNIDWVIKFINFSKSFYESHIWLFIVDTDYGSNFLQMLCKLKLRLDSDITLALVLDGIDTREDINLENIAKIYQFASIDKIWAKNSTIASRTIQHVMFHDKEKIGLSVKSIREPTNKFSKLFSIAQIYKIRSDIDESCISRELGFHSLKGIIAREFIIPEERTNMFQFPLKIARLDYKNASDNDGLLNEKLAMDHFTNYLLQIFNASLELRLFSQEGDHLPNGKWTDAFESIHSGESDIGIFPSIITNEHQQHMQFPVPIFKNFRSIYLHQPESSSIRDIYISPFTPVLLCMVLLMCGSMALLLKLSYELTEHETLNCSDCVMWCAGILFMQGTICIPNSTPSLGIIIVALLFSLLVCNAYSASITSVLSIQLQEIISLSDVLSTDFSVGYTIDDVDDSFFNETSFAPLKEFYKRSKIYKTNLVKTNLEGLKKVVTSRHSHFGLQKNTRRAIFQLPKHQRCMVSEVKIEEAMSIIGLPMQKYSPYVKIVRMSLLKMQERGILSNLEKFISPNLPQCEDSSQFSSAKLSDVFTGFALMISAVVLSSVLIILEIVWKRGKAFRQKQNILFPN